MKVARNGDRVSINSANLKFLGRFTTSPGGDYVAALSHGHGVVEGGTEKWSPGKVLLLRRDDLLWVRDVADPWVAKVANDGTVIAINREEKLASTLGGTLLAFNFQGQPTLKKEFDFNLNDCGISGDGQICFVSTLAPDNSLYSFGIPSGELVWKLNDKDASTGLIRIDDEKAILEIHNRQGLGIQRTLDFAGNPVSSQSEESRSKIRAITPDAESTETVLGLLDSSNSATVLMTLDRLKVLLSRRRVSLEAARFVPTLKQLYKSDTQKISQLAFDNLVLILERHPDSKENILQFLITSLESSPMDTRSLSRLARLARVDAGSLSCLIPRIRDSLVSSPQWNERRFAAFAIGDVGRQRPDLVEDCIPYLVRYVIHPEDTKEKPAEVRFGDFRMGMSPAAMLGVNPGVWLKDAAIDAIGSIGSADPRLVADSVPILERVASSDQSPFSRKKAQRALQYIRNGQVKIP